MFEADDEATEEQESETLDDAEQDDNDCSSEDSVELEDLEDVLDRGLKEWRSPELLGGNQEDRMKVQPVPECGRCGANKEISARFIGEGKTAQFCPQCSELFDALRAQHATEFLGDLTGIIGIGSLLDGIKNMYPEFNREDPDLKATPRRVTRMFAELCRGYSIDPDSLLATVFNVKGKQAGLITIGPIDFVSTCMHHLASISGRAYVGYVPSQKIESYDDPAIKPEDKYTVTGLSKIPRVVHAYSRRLILQEGMTHDIIECIERNLKPLGSAVFVKAKHDCMCKRGVASANAWTVTTEVRGVLYENQRGTKDEFMSVVEQSEMGR